MRTAAPGTLEECHVGFAQRLGLRSDCKGALRPRRTCRFPCCEDHGTIKHAANSRKETIADDMCKPLKPVCTT